MLPPAALAAGALRCGGGTPDLDELAARYDPDLDCTDTSGLFAAHVETREKNEYVNRSTTRDRYCFNCENYQEADTPSACGTCTTVQGPINPLGCCKAWTKRRF